MADQSTSGKKGRKIGRNKKKCEQYRAHNTRAKNKIKRVLQSNGLAYAIVYAREHSLPPPTRK